ncbi:MAG: stage 0 sporulation family protein [Chloroflexi bacterium RBG_13_48_17]|jgi:cell fate regulator YaaT (PSP1 superfamily)|nr:MAG: stage 0 sporulation family protein [Chloroflexi bacterium RBG_13_48_17]
MPEIVGVRFHQAGRVYYFDASGIPLEVNDDVVVETSRGHELGKVVIAPKQVLLNEITEPLKPIIRKAQAEDIEKAQQQQKRAMNAIAKCQELVEKLNLPMKPISAQYNLDRSHLTIFFSAEKRVDFRELAREISHSLKTRVELRQVGARDEAKLIGGLGKCGFPLCCTTFLSEFEPVSIKMAKEQDIALNPMKTSGVCGRLLCCLNYEYEQYRAMKEKLPPLHQEVSTALGNAKVVSRNPLKETATVELETGVTVELPLSQIDWHEKPSDDKKQTKS